LGETKSTWGPGTQGGWVIKKPEGSIASNQPGRARGPKKRPPFKGNSEGAGAKKKKKKKKRTEIRKDEKKHAKNRVVGNSDHLGKKKKI